MSTEDHPYPIEGSSLDQLLGTAAYLLGRLEDQPNRNLESALASEQLRGSQQHARMSIVPAGVHDTIGFRGERQPGFLMNRQSIDIGAQGDRGNVRGTRKIGDDTRPAHTPVPDTETIQHLTNALGSTFLLPRQLWVSVQVPAYRHHLLEDCVIYRTIRHIAPYRTKLRKETPAGPQP
jgi:hypothetical protein